MIDILSAVIGAVIGAVLGGIFGFLGTFFGWWLSEFSKRGRVKFDRYKYESRAEKAGTYIPNTNQRKVEYVTNLEEVERIPINLDFQFFNSSPEKNFMELKRLSITCGARKVASEPLKIFVKSSPSDMLSQTLDRVPLDGLETKTCQSNAYFELSDKMRKSKYLQKFGKVVLYYKDKKGKKKKKLCTYRELLDASIVRSRSALASNGAERPSNRF